MKKRKELRDYVFYSRLFLVVVIMIIKGSYDTIKFYGKDWSQFGGHIVGLLFIGGLMYIIFSQYKILRYYKKIIYMMRKKYTFL